MEPNKVYEIELSDYGMEGRIIMGKPSYRKFTDMKNEVSRRVELRKKEEGGDVKLVGVLQGDIDIIAVLTYVRSAPFRCTVDGWLAYCDRLEAIDYSYSYDLFDRMKAIAEEVEAEHSPFAESQEAETSSSESANTAGQ